MIGFTPTECQVIDRATKAMKSADKNQRELKTVRDRMQEVVKGGEVLLHLSAEQLQTLIRALERKDMVEDEKHLTEYLYDLLCLELSRLQPVGA